MAKRKDRDIEKGYSVKQMVAKLRRLADCLENGKQFQIQIAGERIQHLVFDHRINSSEISFEPHLVSTRSDSWPRQIIRVSLLT